MLNTQAWQLCDQMEQDAERLGIAVMRSPAGTRLIDCGLEAGGGLEAGRRMAEICLGGLGHIEFAPAGEETYPGPAVLVRTDRPLAACLASQYAGWRIAQGKYFAMGSGPMRAAYGHETLFEKIGHRERPSVAVGVLEARKFPPEPLLLELAQQCGVEPAGLTLLAAPTASLAGTVQVVARSVETALHKLVELDFPVEQIVAGWGVAPLPPVAKEDIGAIGRTNDAILYGGEVTLWLRSEDERLEAIGPHVPSGASADHGQPFASIFARYHHDFYRIDPHLFSPAVITLVNLTSGRSFRFGHLLPRVLHESFESVG